MGRSRPRAGAEPLDPGRMALLGRVGGLTTMTRHGADEVAGRARQGFADKFRREASAAHPDWAAERVEREAARLLRLHMARLALRRAGRKAGAA